VVGRALRCDLFAQLAMLFCGTASTSLRRSTSSADPLHTHTCLPHACAAAGGTDVLDFYKGSRVRALYRDHITHILTRCAALRAGVSPYATGEVGHPNKKSPATEAACPGLRLAPQAASAAAQLT